MIFRTARESDLPRLRTLWKQCFGDEDFFIDAFFSALFRPERCAVAEEAGKAVAMAHLLPCALEDRGAPPAAYAAAYLYGMCTDPAFRSRGVGLGLLDFAARLLAERKVCAIALLPADEGLFDFYAKAGYEIFFEPQVKDEARCVLRFSPEMEEFQRFLDRAYGGNSFAPDGGGVSGHRAMLKRLPGFPAWEEGSVRGYLECALE
jgi:GNAT superfamily N-acetyltransferase